MLDLFQILDSLAREQYMDLQMQNPDVHEYFVPVSA